MRPLPHERSWVGLFGREAVRRGLGIVLILCICVEIIAAEQPYSIAAEMPLSEATGAMPRMILLTWQLFCIAGGPLQSNEEHFC